MNPRPTIGIDFDSLPTDASARHELLVDFFGRHLFWCRHQACEFARRAISNPELRKRLGRIPAEPYTRVSELSEDAKAAALALARAAIDNFMQHVLGILTAMGSNQELGEEHAIRYKLIMEIVAQEDPDKVLAEEIINRDGAKAFFDYFGRWLNRHHDSSNAA